MVAYYVANVVVGVRIPFSAPILFMDECYWCNPKKGKDNGKEKEKRRSTASSS